MPDSRGRAGAQIPGPGPRLRVHWAQDGPKGAGFVRILVFQIWDEMDLHPSVHPFADIMIEFCITWHGSVQRRPDHIKKTKLFAQRFWDSNKYKSNPENPANSFVRLCCTPLAR